MEHITQQRRLIDIAATCLPLIVMTLAIFLVSVVSLVLPEPRQRSALKVIDRLNTVVLALNGRSAIANRKHIGD